MKRILLSLMLIALVGICSSDAQILISKVDPASDLITLTNYGPTPASVTPAWQLCSQITYISFAAVTVVAGNANFPTMPPGSSFTIQWPIADAGADLGLYNSANFTSATAMEHFVQWGGSFPFPAGRENVAAAKGIWTSGTFITPGLCGEFGYSGALTPTGVSDWMNFYSVTLSVDMSFETVSDSGVHVAGNFQGWNPATTLMTNVGNNCYEYTICVKAGEILQYKFINGNAWGLDESVTDTACGGAGAYGTDRLYQVPNNDVSVPKACFGSCSSCIPPIPLTLYVDLSNLDSIADTVTVGGSFNGFNPSANIMTPIGNNVYCATVMVTPGEQLTYKFVNGNGYDDNPENVNSGPCAANNGFGDRSYTVPIGVPSDTIPVVCFSSCNTCDNLVDVTFYVNMCLVDTIDSSGVFIGGTFNNFDAGLNPMADSGNGIWCVTIKVNANDTILYKFNNGGSFGGFFEQGDTLCGQQDGFGGFNRVVITGITNIVLDTVCWNGCDDCVKPIACPVPTNPTTTGIGFFEATLGWDIMPGALGYELEGGLLGSNPNSYIQFTKNGGSNNSLFAPGLDKETSYEWHVRTACFDAGQNVIYSDWTPLVIFSTLICNPPNPSTTTNVLANTATLSWTTQPNSIGYIVRGQQIGSSVITLNVPGGGTGSLPVTGLTPNTAYAWAATTVCSLSPFIESPFPLSQINNFTTLPSSSSKVGFGDGNAIVYPNPAESTLNVANLNGDETDIRLYDLSGRLLIDLNSSQSSVQIDVKGLPNGIYQIVIEDADSWKTEKLVISK